MSRAEVERAEVERATSLRVQAGFGVPGTAASDTLDGDEPCVSEFPQARDTFSCREKVAQKLQDTRPIADGVDGVLQCEQRMNRI